VSNPQIPQGVEHTTATPYALGRFADEDLAQLMRHQATTQPGKVRRLDEQRSLQRGTSARAGFGS
jgi:hypothetical protein